MQYKKITALILALVVVLSGSALAFAATATIPSDIAGAACEAAVTTLIEKGIVKGYPDGTYRPNSTVSRAEACVMVGKSMKPTAEALLAAEAGTRFSDLAGYDWAKPYIYHAASRGVVHGYPDGRFKPAGLVTYNEMATMLVGATGHKVADLAGVWPDNVMKQAVMLGMMEGFAYKGSDAALRGHVAMMLYKVFDQIGEANPPTYADLAGKLAAYTGRAYGILDEVNQVLGSDGKTVSQLGFRMGAHYLYVNAKTDVTMADTAIAERYAAGDLFGLRLADGTVQALATSNNAFAGIGSPTGFDHFGITAWATVTARTGDVVTVDLAGTKIQKTIFHDASIYKAVVESGAISGYESGTLSQIQIGSQVRLYQVTGKTPGVAEVVLIK